MVSSKRAVVFRLKIRHFARCVQAFPITPGTVFVYWTGRSSGSPSFLSAGLPASDCLQWRGGGFVRLTAAGAAPEWAARCAFAKTGMLPPSPDFPFHCATRSHDAKPIQIRCQHKPKKPLLPAQLTQRGQTMYAGRVSPGRFYWPRAWFGLLRRFLLCFMRVGKMGGILCSSL